MYGAELRSNSSTHPVRTGADDVTERPGRWMRAGAANGLRVGAGQEGRPTLGCVAIHRASLRCHAQSLHSILDLLPKVLGDPMGATAGPDQAGTARTGTGPPPRRAAGSASSVSALLPRRLPVRGGVHRLIIGRDDNIARSDQFAAGLFGSTPWISTPDGPVRPVGRGPRRRGRERGRKGAVSHSLKCRSQDPTRHAMSSDVSPGSRGPHSAAVLLSSPALRAGLSGQLDRIAVVIRRARGRSSHPLPWAAAPALPSAGLRPSARAPGRLPEPRLPASRGQAGSPARSE